MKKRLFLLPVILFFATYNSFSQGRYAPGIISEKNDSLRKGTFIILPAVGYAQEKGWEFGLVSLSSFYTDKSDTLTRSSTISGAAAYTTKKQSNFNVKADVWAPANRYHYAGNVQYKNFPFSFYGVGDRTSSADKDVITQKTFKINADAEKLLRRGVYVGLSAGFENYSFTDKDSGGIYQTSRAVRDKEGGKLIYVGVSQIIDSRNTNTYTTAGTYIRLNYSFIPDIFGEGDFSGSVFKLDFRTFKSYSKKSVLGVQVNYHTLRGSSTPFYLMPQLGNDQIMRGYYTGRFRNNNLLAGQGELRYRFNKYLGSAFFAGLGTVYARTLRYVDVKPSYGGGLRYFVNPKRGLTLRLDYGFGEKRSGEKRQQGFYLSFGEAF